MVLEIDRFNLELNFTPAPLAGRSQQAHHNFYRAAQLGLGADHQRARHPVHTWPVPEGRQSSPPGPGGDAG